MSNSNNKITPRKGHVQTTDGRLLPQLGGKITRAEYLASTKKKGRIRGAQKINTPDGKFDSKAEYERWCELKLLQLGGKIFNLRRQVAYPIEINGIHICVWIADYVYTDFKTGKEVAEDLKGISTDVFKLKRKMVEAYYGFKILVTSAKGYKMDKRRIVW